MVTTEKPKRLAFCCHAVRLLGWLSEWTITSSPALSVRPLETMLLASLVLRVITISSGVTRRNAARALRVFSFSPDSRARFWPDGSRSTLLVSRIRASSTGLDAGQRLAAFSTPRSGGITNCARTAFQNDSPVPAAAGLNACGAGAFRAQAVSAKRAAEPPTANRRAKSRRDTDADMGHRLGTDGLQVHRYCGPQMKRDGPQMKHRRATDETQTGHR